MAMSAIPFDLLRHDWKDAGFVRAVLKPVNPFRFCEILADIMDEVRVKRLAGVDRVPPS
jgi:hypothetical protein